MYKRILSFLLLFLFISCNKKNANINLETKIDFSKVDSPPILKNCRNLIDEEKEKCFENLIKETFDEEFSRVTLKNEKLINNKFTIKLTFHKTGKTLIEKTNFIDTFVNENRDLEKAIQKAIKRLHFVYPATKQGIPVTTVYTLPISISE